jgi:hypothetical protein
MVVTKVDLKKELKHLYGPSTREVSVVRALVVGATIDVLPRLRAVTRKSSRIRPSASWSKRPTLPRRRLGVPHKVSNSVNSSLFSSL